MESQLAQNPHYAQNGRTGVLIASACKCQLTLAPGLSVTQEKHRPNDRRGRDCNEPTPSNLLGSQAAPKVISLAPLGDAKGTRTVI
jgi:hypothetical protein